MLYRVLLLFLIPTIFLGEQLTANFKNLSIEDFIKISAKVLNKNILLSEKIEGQINFASSSSINKTQLKELLVQTLRSKGYELIEKKELLRIVKINKDPKQKLEQKNSRVELISLEHSEAKESLAILQKLIQSKRALDQNYKVVASLNEQNNQIILMGEAKALKELKNLLHKLDQAKRQVYVQAMIIELNDNLLKEVGARYGIFAGESSNNALLTFASNLNNGEAISFNPSLIGLNPQALQTAVALGVSLSLLKQNYALNIISEPSILCLDNEESMIYVGERISLKTATTTTTGGNISDQFAREDIGLTLKVKPRVLSDDKVTLFIHAQLEGIKNTTTNEQPDTTKKEVRTTAIVEDAQSVIIGGLIEDKSENSVEAIPLFSKLPVVGEAFKHKSQAKAQKSLVMIITPYLVPKNKDLSFIHKRLSSLKALESQYLKRVQRSKSSDEVEFNKEKRSVHEQHRALLMGEH